MVVLRSRVRWLIAAYRVQAVKKWAAPKRNKWLAKCTMQMLKRKRKGNGLKVVPSWQSADRKIRPPWRGVGDGVFAGGWWHGWRAWRPCQWVRFQEHCSTFFDWDQHARANLKMTWGPRMIWRDVKKVLFQVRYFQHWSLICCTCLWVHHYHCDLSPNRTQHRSSLRLLSHCPQYPVVICCSVLPLELPSYCASTSSDGFETIFLPKTVIDKKSQS